ncbi:MAG: YkgJ family cysteine cluster protein [Deltaproteobacteria bacterium]|nr:YkgJ family cysteine cluster protein [Deltaproteobacteria bacterium]
MNQKDRRRFEGVHAFQFNCFPGVSCFTNCCQDITIVLTPYDILRLKNNLQISSGDFLDKYTIMILKKGHLIPMVILKMNEDDKKCPFVTPEGCSVYADRPWPCRMYPLDANDDGTYSLITESSRCMGLKEKDTHKISEWLESQGISPYEEMNEYLSSLIIQIQAQPMDIDNPQVQKMLIMSLYNVDKFREFIFNSSFLERLEVEPEILDAIRKSDEELLKFAYEWIKFGLFGKKVLWVKGKPDQKSVDVSGSTTESDVR